MNGHHFPLLASMARDVFAMPCSSSSSERAFSESGLVINDRRTRLDPRTAQMLIFCQQNFALLAPKIDKWDLMTEDERKEEEAREARARVMRTVSPETDSQDSQDLLAEPVAGGSQSSGPSQIPDTDDAYPSTPKRAKTGKGKGKGPGPKCSKK